MTLAVPLPPRAPVRDEKGIHGVTLGQGLRFTTVEAAGCHARLGAIGVLQVGVTVLPSAAHLGVQGVRHRRSQLVLHLLLPLVYRWRDVILDVAILTETNPKAGHRVCDGACKSKRVIQVVVMIRSGHIGRREIIKLDLLHQK